MDTDKEKEFTTDHTVWAEEMNRGCIPIPICSANGAIDSSLGWSEAAPQVRIIPKKRSAVGAS